MSARHEKPGLGEYWTNVMQVLHEIIPVYDKVNSYISLGRDAECRRRGIRNRVAPGDRILDAGSGFGNMSKTAVEICGDLEVHMYDPMIAMLKRAGPERPEASCGVFEHIPFGAEKFDAVLCGYSLRDAMDLRAAVAELHRVLKRGGRLVIVDLGKPDGAAARACVSFYLRVALPLIAFAAGGRLGLRFAAIYETYKRWPRNADLEGLLLERFSRVEFDKDLMGGAVMIAAYK